MSSRQQNDILAGLSAQSDKDDLYARLEEAASIITEKEEEAAEQRSRASNKLTELATSKRETREQKQLVARRDGELEAERSRVAKQDQELVGLRGDVDLRDRQLTEQARDAQKALEDREGQLGTWIKKLEAQIHELNPDAQAALELAAAKRRGRHALIRNVVQRGFGVLTGAIISALVFGLLWLLGLSFPITVVGGVTAVVATIFGMSTATYGWIRGVYEDPKGGWRSLTIMASLIISSVAATRGIPTDAYTWAWVIVWALTWLGYSVLLYASVELVVQGVKRPEHRKVLIPAGLSILFGVMGAAYQSNTEGLNAPEFLWIIAKFAMMSAGSALIIGLLAAALIKFGATQLASIRVSYEQAKSEALRQGAFYRTAKRVLTFCTLAVAVILMMAFWPKSGSFHGVAIALIGAGMAAALFFFVENLMLVIWFSGLYSWWRKAGALALGFVFAFATGIVTYGELYAISAMSDIEADVRAHVVADMRGYEEMVASAAIKKADGAKAKASASRAKANQFRADGNEVRAAKEDAKVVKAQAREKRLRTSVTRLRKALGNMQGATWEEFQSLVKAYRDAAGQIDANVLVSSKRAEAAAVLEGIIAPELPSSTALGMHSIFDWASIPGLPTKRFNGAAWTGGIVTLFVDFSVLFLAFAGAVLGASGHEFRVLSIDRVQGRPTKYVVDIGTEDGIESGDILNVVDNKGTVRGSLRANLALGEHIFICTAEGRSGGIAVGLGVIKPELEDDEDDEEAPNEAPAAEGSDPFAVTRAILTDSAAAMQQAAEESERQLADLDEKIANAERDPIEPDIV